MCDNMKKILANIHEAKTYFTLNAFIYLERYNTLAHKQAIIFNIRTRDFIKLYRSLITISVYNVDQHLSFL